MVSLIASLWTANTALPDSSVFFLKGSPILKPKNYELNKTFRLNKQWIGQMEQLRQHFHLVNKMSISI